MVRIWATVDGFPPGWRFLIDTERGRGPERRESCPRRTCSEKQLTVPGHIGFEISAIAYCLGRGQFNGTGDGPGVFDNDDECHMAFHLSA